MPDIRIREVTFIAKVGGHDAAITYEREILKSGTSEWNVDILIGETTCQLYDVEPPSIAEALRILETHHVF